MKHFVIVIEGDCASDIPQEWLDAMSSCAEVQVVEPEISNPDDVWNPLKFDTFNVVTTCEVAR